MPQNIIFSSDKYPSVEVGYVDTFKTLRTWVLTRLAWMEEQLAAVKAVRCQRSIVYTMSDIVL